MSQRNLFKRAKIGHVPGDLIIQTKARMLESREPFYVFPWQRIGEKCISGFRREQKVKAKTKFNRRADRDMEEQLHN